MRKPLIVLMILVILAGLFALPTRTAAAEGAHQVNFTAISAVDCTPDPSWCSFGELRSMPNGKAFVTGWKLINRFYATDPRWNADCYFAGDPFPPGGGAYPVTGSFTCYPREAKYAGGWWAGSINQVYQPDKVLGVWHAKGYGTLENLEVIVYQNNLKWYGNVPPGTTDVGVIIELPGYQP